MDGILRTEIIGLGWGLKSPFSLLVSFQHNPEKRSMWPCVGSSFCPWAVTGVHEAGSEPSASSLPGTALCCPAHSHAVFHLRCYRHAGKHQPLSPSFPFSG